MKLASLFSGGKDSTYSIYKTKQQGNQIECLITIHPVSDESMLLHFPNIKITKLQAEAMNLPQLYVKSESDQTDDEVKTLEQILEKAKKTYNVQGVVHGGILSEFQKNIFNNISSKLNLKLISPVWHDNQINYMKELLEKNFHFIITSVSSGGLDESWLGKEIISNDLTKLEQLSKKYGFNVNFDGGEAETLVVNCPLFSHPVQIVKSQKIWDGYRGRFEIQDAKLDYRARKS